MKTALKKILDAIDDSEQTLVKDSDFKITDDMDDLRTFIEERDLSVRNAFKLGFKLRAEVFGK